MNSSVDIEPEDSKKVNAPKMGERILDHEKWGNVLTLTGHRSNKLYGYADVDDPAYDKIRGLPHSIFFISPFIALASAIRSSSRFSRSLLRSIRIACSLF